jgi:hypothetical protein
MKKHAFKLFLAVSLFIIFIAMWYLANPVEHGGQH